MGYLTSGSGPCRVIDGYAPVTLSGHLDAKVVVLNYPKSDSNQPNCSLMNKDKGGIDTRIGAAG